MRYFPKNKTPIKIKFKIIGAAEAAANLLCEFKIAEKKDAKLTNIKNGNVILPERRKDIKEVFHLYHLRFKTKKLRNKILRDLIKNKIDGKIHYPTSMHLQPAAKKYKYSKGDFPIAEQLSETSISLPVHEFVLKKDLLNMCNIIFKSLKK